MVPEKPHTTSISQNSEKNQMSVLNGGHHLRILLRQSAQEEFKLPKEQWQHCFAKYD